MGSPARSAVTFDWWAWWFMSGHNIELDILVVVGDIC